MSLVVGLRLQKVHIAMLEPVREETCLCSSAAVLRSLLAAKIVEYLVPPGVKEDVACLSLQPVDYLFVVQKRERQVEHLWVEMGSSCQLVLEQYPVLASIWT
jgi:hypothetical protein